MLTAPLFGIMVAVSGDPADIVRLEGDIIAQ